MRDSSQFSLVDYLQAQPYFFALPRPSVEEIAAQMIRKDALPGETIFLEGEPALGLWIVEQGRVKIYKLNPNGEEHVLRLFGDGDTFNEVGAFDGGPNPANAAALSETNLWVLPSAVLHTMILTNSAFALHIIQILSQKMRGLVGQIENLALYSVIVRLARFLLKQAQDPALSGPGVTRSTIAAHLATTPQTISTALRELETSGAIEFDRHRIVIVREDILRSIAML